MLVSQPDFLLGAIEEDQGMMTPCRSLMRRHVRKVSTTLYETSHVAQCALLGPSDLGSIEGDNMATA